MRNTLDNLLCQYNDVYFLHADMWSFKKYLNTNPEYVINCGLQETNMVNIATGLASQGKKVVIYGVAGFVLYKTYSQIKLNIINGIGQNGTILFINAGHNGCYNNIGRGHIIDDDLELCEILKLSLYDPINNDDFKELVIKKLEKKGCSFIRLGFDTSI